MDIKNDLQKKNLIFYGKRKTMKNNTYKKYIGKSADFFLNRNFDFSFVKLYQYCIYYITYTMINGT